MDSKEWLSVFSLGSTALILTLLPAIVGIVRYKNLHVVAVSPRIFGFYCLVAVHGLTFLVMLAVLSLYIGVTFVLPQLQEDGHIPNVRALYIFQHYSWWLLLIAPIFFTWFVPERISKIFRLNGPVENA